MASSAPGVARPLSGRAAFFGLKRNGQTPGLGASKRVSGHVHHLPGAVSAARQVVWLGQAGSVPNHSDLHGAGARAEHRGRLRRAAGPWLRRVLRHRWLHGGLSHLATEPAGRHLSNQLLRGDGAVIPRRRDVRHHPGRTDASPARRLPGHRHPGLRRDRPARVPEPRAMDQRLQKASTRSAARRSRGSKTAN